MSAGDFVLSKSDILPLQLTDDLEAKTLAGRLFQSAMLALDPSLQLNQNEYKKASQRSDQFAVVTADTIAMLPGMRLAAAGLVRAGALIDLSGKGQNSLLDFSKNFLEGAALQKISSSMMPGGALSDGLNRRLGKGVLADSSNFLLGGAAIGASSSAFRSESWLDKQGQFSISAGMTEALKSGGLAAGFALPAAFIGSRINRLGMNLARDGRISQTTAMAFSGVGSGYLSGTVIGGSQAYFAGNDWQGILEGAKDGGLIGGLSGGLSLAAMFKLAAPAQSKRNNFEIDESKLRQSAKEVQETGPESANREQGRNISPELWDSLEIKSGRLDDAESGLRGRLERLGPGYISKAQYYVAAENAELIAAQSNNFQDFVRLGGMRLVSDDVRFYQGPGLRISLPESYAASLDEVLALRLQAAESANLYVDGADQVKRVYAAREALEKHPLKNKAHPADIVQLVEELPDRSFLSEVMLRPDRSPDDAWSSKDVGKKFQAAASAGEANRSITFFAQDRSPLLRDYMKHEWGHHLKWRSPEESTRFDQAALLEKDGYYVSQYSRRNNDENWAEHLASLLHPDPDRFLATVHGAPLRSLEMGTALARNMAASPPWARGSLQSELSARLSYIQKYVIPEAQTKLMSNISTAPRQIAMDSMNLLYRIAGDNEFNSLAALARTHNDASMREAAFLAAWSRVVHRDNRGNGRVGSEPSAGMRDYLVQQAQEGSKSRDMALQMLSAFRDEKSRFQHELLTFNNSNENKLSRAISLLERSPDAASQKTAFNYALKASTGPDERVNLALRALDRYPRLTLESVNILAASGQQRVRPFLHDLKNHYDARVAERAAKALQGLDKDAELSKLAQALQDGSQSRRLGAAAEIAGSGSPRAASLLAEAYLAAGSELERTLILRAAREKISPAVWKFEIRRKKAENPQKAAFLDRAMKH